MSSQIKREGRREGERKSEREIGRVTCNYRAVYLIPIGKSQKHNKANMSSFHISMMREIFEM